jgi:hypothetical protein
MSVLDMSAVGAGELGGKECALMPQVLIQAQMNAIVLS